MKRIILSASVYGPRLGYVAKEIFERRLGIPFHFASEIEAEATDFEISYGIETDKFCIPNCGLLEETGWDNASFPWQDDQLVAALTVLNNRLSVDIFGIVFWFLSRYEEYQYLGPFDEHGRFPSDASVLNKMNLLDFPVVDALVFKFAKILEKEGVSVSIPKFDFEFSFDIDNPTAYAQKGFLRSTGGFLKDLFAPNYKSFQQRLAVLTGLEKDPFDHFKEMETLAVSKDRKTNVFFWIGNFGKHDKGLHWQNPYFQELIKTAAAGFEIGIHPSYAAFLNEVQLQTEKERLEQITGNKILKSRFHFLRFKLPESYQLLINQGIEADFSMGFGDRSGYRAGTGRSFFWYDLKSEKETNLKITPFVFMDSTAHFKLKLNAEAFLQKVESQIDLAKSQGGIVHIVFHNEHFSWPGWKGVVSKIMKLL